MALVYIATSPSNKSYIGITSQTLKRRKIQHASRAKTGSRAVFHFAVRKYGINGFSWNILKDNVTWEEALVLEKTLIEKFNTFEKGYNGTLGGEGTIGAIYSEESKYKMGSSSRGKPNSKKTRLAKSISKGGKPFLVYEKSTGKFVGEWTNQRQCGRDLNIKKEHLWRCLNGKRQSTKGYVFKFKESN